MPSPDEPSQQTVVLFDGHNMLFRYFRGMPRTIVSTTGDPIHGAYGFVASVLQHLRKFQPVRAIVCLDSAGPPERTSEDSSYKGNRQWDYSDTQLENPFSQLAAIEAAMRVLGVPVLSKAGVEADDLIATCVKKYHSPATEVIIASGDKDLHQLVRDGVRIYQKRGKEEIFLDKEKIESLYGVEIDQIADWKALVGDVSDNIPGIPGVGPKTATILLRQHFSIANLIKSAPQLSPRMRKLVLDNRALLETNLKLIALNDQVELDSLEIDAHIRIPNSSVGVRSVFQELGLM